MVYESDLESFLKGTLKCEISLCHRMLSSCNIKGEFICFEYSVCQYSVLFTY